MEKHREVLAICVNWNGKAVLAETLRSLLSSTYPHLSVLVVDNASTDHSDSLVPQTCELLQLTENKGYGGAINEALSEAARRGLKPAYYLVLNNDLVLHPDTVSALVSCAEQAGPGIFGPKILQVQSPDRLDMAWGELTYSHVLARFRGKGAKDGPRWDIAGQVPLLQGSVLLISAEVLAATGGFDEAFFMYHEEVDFEVRAGARGFPCYYCPTARVRHHSGQSSRREPALKVFWTRRNSVYFLRKHRVGVGRWAVYFGSLVCSILYNLGTLRIGRARTILQAIRAGFRMPVVAEIPRQAEKGAPAKPNA